jgi:energy-coupling factor transporter ATP-binding protein EcfA2
MPTALSEFRIEGLHGRNRIIDIPIKANRLVLVGENGTGKSTVANLLYYTLTQQWHRILDYRFTAIQVRSGDSQVQLTHEDVEALAAYKNVHINPEWRRRYPPALLRQISQLIANETLFTETGEEFFIERIAGLTQSSPNRAKQLFLDISASQGAKLKKTLAEELKRLESWKFGQFLYLPTYRRIEQDLKSIFRGLDIEEKVRQFRERFRAQERSSFIELIEFGMEDVDRTIQVRMEQIKERVRTGLSTLTGTYLREVIRGLKDTPDLSVLRSMNFSHCSRESMMRLSLYPTRGSCKRKSLKYPVLRNIRLNQRTRSSLSFFRSSCRCTLNNVSMRATFVISLVSAMFT